MIARRVGARMLLVERALGPIPALVGRPLTIFAAAPVGRLSIAG